MKRIKNLFIIASIYVAGCTSAPPTYYLDATNGDDTNSGLSADDAWKTLKRTENLSMEKGSKLLLKRGETFKGELKITGNGVSQAPIFIDAYGEGKQNPRIIGNDSSMYAVCISNSDYLTIQNLEIINTGKKHWPDVQG